MPQGYHEIPNTRDDLYAFRVTDALDADGLHEMSERMNDVFDRAEGKVDLLLIFDVADASNLPSGSFDWESIKVRFRSLTNIDKYVVANAPAGAAAMVEAMGKIIPVQAESFDDAAQAWGFLNARPL